MCKIEFCLISFKKRGSSIDSKTEMVLTHKMLFLLFCKFKIKWNVYKRLPINFFDINALFKFKVWYLNH